MSEQIGWRALMREVREEAPYWGVMLPRLPRLLSRRLAEESPVDFRVQLQQILAGQKRQSGWLVLLSIALGTLLLIELLHLLS